jgi:hypothetical protein
VEWTSADSRIARTRDVPSARALQMSERCEMDLSPGTVSSPATRRRVVVIAASSRARSPRRSVRRGT